MQTTEKFAFVSTDPMFRNLTAQEVAEFRHWVHLNPGTEDNALFHPIIRREIALLKAGK